MLAAVDGVLADYREEMERQTQEIARTVVSTPVGSLQPKVELRFIATGVEAVIRYPVDLKNSAEIDERVARAVLTALEQDPKVQLAADGAANIHVTTEPLGDAKS